MKHLIQIVEDDLSVKKLLEFSLSEYGFECVASSNRKSALEHFLQHAPHLVILDLGLPDGDGKVLIQKIREIADTPIIVLTARVDEKEIITSLNMGADDYVTKPFSMQELIARVQANLRRFESFQAEQTEFCCNSIKLNLDTRSVLLHDDLLKLTPIEFEILKFFMKHPNKTLTHKQILKEVWGVGYQNEMQYLRSYINTLRKKIEPKSTQPSYIKTESGIGYRFICHDGENLGV